MGVFEPLTVHSWSTQDKGGEERPLSGFCGAEGTRLHSDSPQLVLLVALFGLFMFSQF